LKDDPRFSEMIEYYDNIHKSNVNDLVARLGDHKFIERDNSIGDNKWGPDFRVVIKISAINPCHIGAKISNRFGGKGTISAVIPYDEMPRIGGEDGERVDICVPPKSVINRKNFSQMYECNLAELSKLAWKMNSESIKSGNYDSVRDVLNHLYLTKKFSEYSDEDLKKFHESFDTYYTIEVGAIDNKYTNEVFIELNEYFNYNTDGDKLFLSKSDEFGPRWVEAKYKATHGTIEFERLHFNPEDKAKATSSLGYHDELIMGIGKGRDGGQRIGQMEVWALIAHDTLKEFLDLGKSAKDQSDSDYTASSVATQMLLTGLLIKK
jgi:DNA-directed RNA polymerase subunit beta